jgi:hypothetical protein
MKQSKLTILRKQCSSGHSMLLIADATQRDQATRLIVRRNHSTLKVRTPANNFLNQNHSIEFPSFLIDINR